MNQTQVGVLKRVIFLCVGLLSLVRGASQQYLQTFAGKYQSDCSDIQSMALNTDQSIGAVSDIAFSNNTGFFYYAVRACNVILSHEYNAVFIIAGSPGVKGYSGDDGLGRDALIGNPTALAVRPDGNYLYFGDDSGRIRRIDLTTGDKTISAVAGTGGVYVPGDANGDNGPALSATFANISGLHFNTSRYLFVTDALIRIRRIDLWTGIVNNYAGKLDIRGNADGSLTDAVFYEPTSIWSDGHGSEMIVYDRGTCAFRKIDLKAGIVSTWWGGNCLSAGDGGNIAQASAYKHVKICGKDRTGNFYFIDQGQEVTLSSVGGCEIRKISASGIITRYAGADHCGNGDDIPFDDGEDADSVILSHEGACTVDAHGVVYFANNQKSFDTRILQVLTSPVTSPTAVPSVSAAPSYSFYPTVVPTTSPSCLWSAEEDSCGGALQEVVIKSTNTDQVDANTVSTTTITRTYRKRA